MVAALQLVNAVAQPPDVALELHDAHVVTWRAHLAAQAEAKAEREAIQDEGNGDATPREWTDGERVAYGMGLIAASEAKARAAAASDDTRNDAKHPLPAPLDLAALASVPVPERLYRVGKIMLAGTAGLVTGHGGAGKTQLGLHLGCCIALARPFFGECVLQGAAAFVSAEDDARELHIRLAQQAGKLGVGLADLAGRFHVYDLSANDATLIVQGGDRDVGGTAAYWQLQAEFERRGVSVAILDNLSSLCDVEINVPGVATRVLGLLSRLVPAGGNVVILAHVDKATAKAGYNTQAYSGTAGWHNRSRWRWYLYPPNAGDDAEPGEQATGDDGRRILAVQKNNAGPTGTRFPLRLTDGVLTADGISGGIVASIERENERKAVLAALREAAERGINVRTAESGISTAYDALEALPSFPALLRGQEGKKHTHWLLRHLRASREIEVYEFIGSGRHKCEGYKLAGTAS